LGEYRDAGGRGPTQTAMKVAYGADQAVAAEMAHRMWATELLPGQLNQELRTPRMFEDASSLVHRGDVARQIPCGPDARHHVDAIEQRARAGYDEVYIQQIGPDMEGFFSLYADEVLPVVHREAAA
ncbi:MAG TPA: hypothetical protein VMD28_08875, partial [Acidimicrobiales bacterium]|nr:hypothetical protein [Acidimicrobiales bacterium]